MTTRYAFKVHSLRLGRGLNGRKPVYPHVTQSEDEAKAVAKGNDGPASRDYVTDLVSTLEALRDTEETFTDVPKLIAVVDGANEHVPSDQPGTPRMVVSDVTRTGRRVSVTVEYGHLGYHHRAVGKTKKEEATLEDKSPVEFFRTEFLIPDKGQRGIVGTEVVSRSSALPALVGWINHSMRTQFGDDKFPRLMVPGLADKKRIQELINGDTVAEIRLSKSIKAGDGVGTTGKLELIEKVRTVSHVQNAQNLVKGWFERREEEKSYTEAERLEQIDLLAEIVDDAAKSMGFTDGQVKLDEGSGRFVTVTPSRVGEIFVYSISDVRPGDTTWEQRVQAQVMAMAKADQLSVAWS